MRKSGEPLRELARACGVQAGFRDAQGRRQAVGGEAVLAALRALGVIEREEEAARALRGLRKSEAERLIEPTIVAWDGRVRFGVRGRGKADCRFDLEDGDTIEWKASIEEGRLRVPSRLPVGRHVLHIGTGRREARAVVLSAPKRLPRSDERALGLFAPLYALRGDHDVGAGDLGDLRRFARWAAEQGCSLVGTLPLLAGYMDERPFEPSPYSPVSRLFWNEMYLELPEVKRRAPAREASMVDYHAVMRAKRGALEARAKKAFADPGERARIDAFLAERPETADYAAFRAEVEARQSTWQSWPGARRAGRVPRSDSPAVRYHIYAQYLLDRELRAVSENEGASVYLDLPVGVNGGGYDVWRYRDAFVTEASTGAPPDALFEGGQDWGFPPPHPMRTREDGHAYFAASLRNHFRYAKVLRIDHVMGLHRLYWIPRGIEARQGVYVQYPADELYAAMSIEAHRAGARVIGENLGTVPEEVNRTMAKRGVMGMFIGQFAMSPDPKSPMGTAPAGTLASLNTHDTPTFAGFMTGHDIDLRVELGILDAEAAPAERRGREAMFSAMVAYARKRLKGKRGRDELMLVLRALLRDLSESEASIVLVALEDLWLEREPQNVPGISEGYPCWRKRARRTMQEIEADTSMNALLREFAERRSGARSAVKSGGAAA